MFNAIMISTVLVLSFLQGRTLYRKHRFNKFSEKWMALFKSLEEEDQYTFIVAFRAAGIKGNFPGHRGEKHNEILLAYFAGVLADINRPLWVSMYDQLQSLWSVMYNDSDYNFEAAEAEFQKVYVNRERLADLIRKDVTALQAAVLEKWSELAS